MKGKEEDNSKIVQSLIYFKRKRKAAKQFLLAVFILLSAFMIAKAVVINLSDGTASYRWNTNSTTSNANLSAAGIDSGNDVMYANLFYISQAGTNYGLTGGSIVTSTANTATVRFNNVNGIFDVDISISLSDAGGTPNLNFAVNVSNTSGAAQTASVLSYYDFDIGNFSQNASNYNATADRMTIWNVNSGEYLAIVGNNNDAIQMSPYEGLRNGLQNSTITSLDNDHSDFGPGDFTGAIQYDFTLNPGEEFEAANITVVPEASSIILLLTGLLFLSLSRNLKPTGV